MENHLMKNFTLQGKSVVVTGGQGFLGKHLTALLEKEDLKSLYAPSSKEVDFRDANACFDAFKEADVVIHLAAKVGGIGFNQKHPGELFYDNIIMGTNVVHQAWKAKVAKLVLLGTICAYPKFTPIPFKESDLWNGYPEETNAPYGLAKKMQLVQSQAYRQEYGFQSIYLLPVNLYGPGDNFNPASSHVIPALIRKFVDAVNDNHKEVTVWGTGNPTREFLYVEDAAEGIILATKHYDGAEPVNLGSSYEISIRELSETIAHLVGFTGEIIFDSSKPDGQPRRKLDVSRAQEEFGFTSQTNFMNGLKKTIAWYQSQP